MPSVKHPTNKNTSKSMLNYEISISLQNTYFFLLKARYLYYYMHLECKVTVKINIYFIKFSVKINNLL